MQSYSNYCEKYKVAPTIKG